MRSQKRQGVRALVSRVSNCLLLSYSLTGLTMKHKHLNQHVLSVTNCENNDDSFRKSLSPQFSEKHYLILCGLLKVVTCNYSVELFSGIYLVIIRLNSSVTSYDCIWCKVSKHQSGDILLPTEQNQ